MNEKIRIESLRKSFGAKHVLRGVDLSVFEGEILCVIGKSGTGKSVILKHLIGLLSPDSGEIYVDGTSFTAASSDEKARLRSQYGYLFQGAALFDSMNIYDNVAFGMRRKSYTEEEIEETVPRMLAHVGLRGVESKRPSELSGGMQKRIGLARAIAVQPRIMLYDEPTTGVDPITAGAIDRLIQKMRESFQMTSVVVTHDMPSAYRIADRIAMLFDGQIIFSGTPNELRQTDNALIRQFIEGRADGPMKIA